MNIYPKKKFFSSASTSQIHNHLKTSGISQVELTPDEVQLIIETLVYDGKIEKVSI